MFNKIVKKLFQHPLNIYHAIAKSCTTVITIVHSCSRHAQMNPLKTANKNEIDVEQNKADE